MTETVVLIQFIIMNCGRSTITVIDINLPGTDVSDYAEMV